MQCLIDLSMHRCMHIFTIYGISSIYTLHDALCIEYIIHTYIRQFCNINRIIHTLYINIYVCTCNLDSYIMLGIIINVLIY